MSRAILADAVALVRGDRYLTYDCTPFNLTSWGFTEGSRNPDNAAWGGVLGRLIQRGLPNHFNATSVYSHFPLMTPTGQPHSMDKILKRIGQLEEYTLEVPEKTGEIRTVVDPNAIHAALSDESNVGLITPYASTVRDLRLSPSFLTVIDEPAKYARVTQLVQSVFAPKDSLKESLDWFYTRTLELVKEKSLELVSSESGTQTHMADIVKDVFRLVPVHWASTKIVGTLLSRGFPFLLIAVSLLDAN